jgi:hypothetical protein
MPRSGMPGAFCNGMVEVQQGLETEVLQTKARETIPTLK